MSTSCKSAWRDHKLKKNVSADEADPNVKMAEKTKDDAAKRKLKYAGAVKTRLTLYPDSLMSQVYHPKDEKQKKSITAATVKKNTSE